MRNRVSFHLLSVACAILLTPVFIAGCSVIKKNYPEYCKTRAYVSTPLGDYLSSRFGQKAPVRMAVIPFTVPPNMTGTGPANMGMGNELAWALQRELLSREVAPITEVLNRQDWPGKREEFFTGNFGALALARQAGYDLVAVGLVPGLHNGEKLSGFIKVIDVEGGITVSFLQSEVSTVRGMQSSMFESLGLKQRTPAELYTYPLTERLITCMADRVAREY